MTVVTRFAPSPTGFLHIGGARTALFNWLFAKQMGGKCLLRVEDTDQSRSTPEAVKAIFEGLRWLELDWDGEPIFQFSRALRHREIAEGLVERGLAYRCYASVEELAQMKAAALEQGRPPLYDGRWRDRTATPSEADLPFVIRLKTPQEGSTCVSDIVQGEVRVQHSQLDDMVLLRSDGTPTYMLSVVVDDHDMGVTHVIRGDDHLTNTFRQVQIYNALGWSLPQFSHIPLIHGCDGAKLSKRHGALGVDAYREMGFLPDALRNYLLRLGWGHGDDEIISTDQAIAWFSLEAIGRSPARFDTDKLLHINGHYLRAMPDPELAVRLQERLACPLSERQKERVLKGIGGLKQRARTLKDLADSAGIYLQDEVDLDPVAVEKFLTAQARQILDQYIESLCSSVDWSSATLEGAARDMAQEMGVGLGKLAQPLRVALTGSSVSPPIFEVMEVLGKALTLKRLERVQKDLGRHSVSF